MAESSPSRRFRFSLRTLLALVVVVAVPLAWVAKERRQSAYETKVAEQLEADGFQVIELGGPYDQSENILFPSWPTRPWWHRLAQQVLGNRVLSVFKPIAETHDITALSRLSNLQYLELTDTQVSDITPLASVHGLEYLRLDSLPLSDLTPLAKLTDLKDLSLSDTQVSDLAPLAHLENLEDLHLDVTQVADISALAGLKSLKSLWLDQTKVTDLGPLAGLKNLESLSVSETQIRDLTPLMGLKNLTHLRVTESAVTKDQVEALQKVLPNCKIEHDPFP